MEKERKETIDGGNRYEETHINNVEVYAPGAGKVENNHTHTVTVQVNINFSVHFHTSFLTKWLHALIGKFGIVCANLCDTHFDGEGQSDVSVYQLSGNPVQIARALRQLDKELGNDATVSVRYISKENRFDRSNLTLLQAIGIAEYESGL